MLIHVLGKGGEGHLGVETVRLGNSGTYQQTVREDTESVPGRYLDVCWSCLSRSHLGIQKQYNSQSA